MVKRDTTVTEKDIVKKPKKAKQPPLSLRETFNLRLASLDIETLKRPWMATKVFRLIDDAHTLLEWVNHALADTSRHKTLWNGKTKLVLGVDTETTGLDIRVLRGKVQTKLAGICLSIDGVEGVYIPVNHEVGKNIDIRQAAPILQRLFDESHLVFFNAKFDREVLRLTTGITFKDYPDYEDVQVLNYLYNPKAQLGEDNKKGGFIAGGLKPTSKALLDIEQIELDELVKVRVKVKNPVTERYSQRQVYAPFTWVPTETALWYAAGDAITTWLLWEYLWKQMDFRKLGGCHRLDHQLIDTITWVERQRLPVDEARHKEVVAFHARKSQQLLEELREIAGEPDLNPKSSSQLCRILFVKRGMVSLEKTGKGQDSTAVGVLKALADKYPDDLFLPKLMDYREYVALHPEELAYDADDKTARFYFKQNVVAGGRLSAAGGEFPVDGGCNLNVQAIKKIGGNWWVYGHRLTEQTDEAVAEATSYETDEHLGKECFDKHHNKAPNLHANNHTATYFGIHYCMVPDCPQHQGPLTKVDANEVLNLRGMFTAPPGWTLFSTDFSNVEMRVAANASGEESFIREFNEGSGDFHTLTAKALFPEFSDPTTPKPRTKELRGLAKIINFALLYGGTSYTIFENLNKAGFHITKEEAQELVDKYWASVPTFAAWCQHKQLVARSQFYCTTPMGRIIKFQSAMEAEKIHYPTDDERNAFFTYKRLLKKAMIAEKAGDKELSQSLQDQAENLWSDKTTGVRNFQDYNKFLGKVERVSVNIPLQGTAGDLMRKAMNRIRFWAQANPGIEKVFRLHGTIHDEIVYAIKNEFVPYVVPRINKLMKLRALHAARKWPVPLETDCEYGQTWDMSYHLTGDNEHTAAGWSGVSGTENYLPLEFDPLTLECFQRAWAAGQQEQCLQECRTLHARVQPLVDILAKVPATEVDKAVKQVVIILQLHEFWNVDEDENEKVLLADWAQEHQLAIPDIPLIGGLPSYLSSIPLDGTEPELTSEPPTDPSGSLTPAEPILAPVVEPPSIQAPCEESDTSFEDVFYEPETAPAKVKNPEPEAPPATPSVPAAPEVQYTNMRALSEADYTKLKIAMGTKGPYCLHLYYKGNKNLPLTFAGVNCSELPEEFRL